MSTGATRGRTSKSMRRSANSMKTYSTTIPTQAWGILTTIRPIDWLIRRLGKYKSTVEHPRILPKSIPSSLTLEVFTMLEKTEYTWSSKTNLQRSGNSLLGRFSSDRVLWKPSRISSRALQMETGKSSTSAKHPLHTPFVILRLQNAKINWIRIWRECEPTTSRLIIWKVCQSLRWMTMPMNSRITHGFQRGSWTSILRRITTRSLLKHVWQDEDPRWQVSWTRYLT